MLNESSTTDGVSSKLSIASVDLPLSSLPLTNAIPRKIVVPPNVIGVQAPEVLRAVDQKDIRWCSIRTCGEDGACGVHAAFGKLGEREMFCNNAKLHAAHALERVLRDSSNSSFFVSSVRMSIWSELARPAAITAVHGERP